MLTFPYQVFGQNAGDDVLDFLTQNKKKLAQIGQDLLLRLYTSTTQASYQTLYEQLAIDSLNLYEALSLETLRSSQQPNNVFYLLVWAFSSAPIKELNRRLRGDRQHSTTRKNYLSAILCIMWSIYEQAIQQSKIIERGSFKINDPDGKLFEFLYGYAQFSTGQASPTIIGANDFAYRRDPSLALSSHYKGDPLQFGIDLRFQGGDYALRLLPHSHSHILFGKIRIDGQDYTFVKFEPAGLGNFAEFLEHALHFTNYTEVDIRTTFREKDIPPILRAHYTRFCEAIGQDLIKKPSIHQMWSHMQQQYSDAAPLAEAAKEAFKSAAEELALDHLSIRTGQEVIIDMSRLIHTVVTTDSYRLTYTPATQRSLPEPYQLVYFMGEFPTFERLMTAIQHIVLLSQTDTSAHALTVQAYVGFLSQFILLAQAINQQKKMGTPSFKVPLVLSAHDLEQYRQIAAMLLQKETPQPVIMSQDTTMASITELPDDGDTPTSTPDQLMDEHTSSTSPSPSP